MLTSEQLDAAIKAEIQRHIQTSIDADIGQSFCSVCGYMWPCQYLIQASISLKLSAIATILSGDFSALQLMQGGIVRGAQGNRDRFQGPKV